MKTIIKTFDVYSVDELHEASFIKAVNDWPSYYPYMWYKENSEIIE